MSGQSEQIFDKMNQNKTNLPDQDLNYLNCILCLYEVSEVF